MTIEELETKVRQHRAITEAKLSYLRDRTRMLDQAFDELQEITEGELDGVYEKIKEIDKRLDLNGLTRNGG